jgi:uncharacterized protein YndB with AHSA1/START domain
LFQTAWDYLFSDKGLQTWLGTIPPGFTRGTCYQAPDGTTCEIRVFSSRSHIRLTWQPPSWPAPSLLQIRVMPAGQGKTTISFHQENLADEATRTAMLVHWKEVLDRLEVSLMQE